MTGPTTPESTLRAHIRGRIESGELPVIRAHNVVAGYGDNSRCNVCHEPVTKTQIEYEITHKTDLLRLHLKCFAAWQLECVRDIENGARPDT